MNDKLKPWTPWIVIALVLWWISIDHTAAMKLGSIFEHIMGVLGL